MLGKQTAAFEDFLQFPEAFSWTGEHQVLTLQQFVGTVDYAQETG